MPNIGTITYNGNKIADISNSGTKTLECNGQVMESNVVVSTNIEVYDGSLYVPPYLRFTANENETTVVLKTVGGSSIQLWSGSYSIDGGVTWTSYTLGTVIELSNIGDSICFKGEFSEAPTDPYSGCVTFRTSGSIAVSGNVMSICSGDSFENVTTLPFNFCFFELFGGCTGITTPPQLPATVLSMGCYNSMFYNCTSLATAPPLPATTLTNSCYYSMFTGCTSLKISEGTGGTSFFTCPSIIPEDAVANMFTGTSGTYTSDPVAGGNYYYY